ncbi:Glutamyl-tRNA reductase [Crateriforma conspicua]|uniref:Glutamyl-tRNA reductase n=2 Tax=Crateriforma conspicua TaxID=2527996 RepID=A0A5C5XSY9_9PLAN|nr:Glutamyl-tRNA reductase [Crateriforma conspicua]
MTKSDTPKSAPTSANSTSANSTTDVPVAQPANGSAGALQMIGCSHHDASVEFREKVSVPADQIDAFLGAFRNRFPRGELVLLSTCNRVELYAASPDPSTLDRRAFADFVANQQRLNSDDVLHQMIHRSGPEAVEHLFTVAASLDSMVLGEAQILSQVKQAYQQANVFGSTGPLTHAVFQAANRAAKRVQQETTIHRRRVSVPSVAVGEVVPEVFDSLADKRVVLCGAGEMAGETLRYLKDAGARDICVLNRSRPRAIELADQFQCESDDWEQLNQRLVGADLLIGTTSAAEPIVSAATFAQIHPRRRGKVLLILDLAVPRDFDPGIDDYSGVYLYQIDDLEAACTRNRREREKEWPKAKKIIAEETERFFHDLNHRATGPVIRRLRNQALEIKDDELVRLNNKLREMGIEEAAIKEIDKSFDRVVNKLLHPPLASLRDDAAEGHSRGLLEALRHLFNLGDD